MTYRLRLARADEAPALQAIERASGIRFRRIGMVAVADAEPSPVADLERAAEAGDLFVAVDGDDRPCGFALYGVIDGLAHLRELSVAPEHAGHRLGAALIEAGAAWARARHLPAVVLTTFVDVAWNAPYYARLGFTMIGPAAQGPGIRNVLADEAERGLNGRCAMIRPVDAAFS